MLIPTTCSQCQASYNLGEALRNKKIRCPKCGAEMLVGQGAGPASATAVQPPRPPQAMPVSPLPDWAVSEEKVRLNPSPASPPAIHVVPLDEDAFSANHGTRNGSGPDKTEPKKPSMVLQGIGIAGGIVGALIGRFVGLPLLIVGVFALLVGTPLYFLTSGRRRAMVPAGALQSGQALWMLLAAVLIASGVIDGMSVPIGIWLEACALVVAGIVVVLLPHLVVVLTLTVYQCLALGVNLVTFVNIAKMPMNESREAMKGIVVHLFVRVLALALMYEAFFRKQESGQATQDGDVDPGREPDDGRGHEYYRRPEPDPPLQPAQVRLTWILAGSLGGAGLLVGIVLGVLFANSNDDQFAHNNDKFPGLKGKQFRDKEWDEERIAQEKREQWLRDQEELNKINKLDHKEDDKEARDKELRDQQIRLQELRDQELREKALREKEQRDRELKEKLAKEKMEMDLPGGSFVKRDDFHVDPAYDRWLKLPEKNSETKGKLGPNTFRDGPLQPKSPLWNDLSQALKANNFKRTHLVNGNAGPEKREDLGPENGGVLIGMVYTHSTYVNSFQGIYMTAAGERLGKSLGAPKNIPVKMLKAAPGYAVGAINIRAGQIMDGFTLVFMKVTDHGLDPSDAYRSQIIGGKGGAPYCLGGDGSYVVGLTSRALTSQYFVYPEAPATLGALLWKSK